MEISCGECNLQLVRFISLAGRKFLARHQPAADGTWWAELVVVDTGPGYALCRVLKAIDLPPRLSDMSDRVPAGFTIVHAKPSDEQGGWHIIRQSDGVMLNGGHLLHRKEDAIRFLLDHSSVRGDSVASIWRGQA